MGADSRNRTVGVGNAPFRTAALRFGRGAFRRSSRAQGSDRRHGSGMDPPGRLAGRVGSAYGPVSDPILEVPVQDDRRSGTPSSRRPDVEVGSRAAGLCPPAGVASHLLTVDEEDHPEEDGTGKRARGNGMKNQTALQSRYGSSRIRSSRHLYLLVSRKAEAGGAVRAFGGGIGLAPRHPWSTCVVASALVRSTVVARW
jgi:hypothetical protein